MNKKSNYFLGVPVGLKALDDLVDESLKAIRGEAKQIAFACANPHSLVVAQKDRVFMEALLDADQVVADGIGVKLMAKYANIEIGPRVTGSDYFFSILRGLNEAGSGRVFFFGSSQKVLDLISEKMRRDYPKLVVAGVLSPPFDAWSLEDNEAMIAEINAARPDVLWVGMTAPKQEKWVYANRHKLSAPMIGSIGAVFDFFAGTYPRAPKWMCRSGLEWVYRLIKEPRRMWRRNFISSPLFVLLVIEKHILRFG